MSIILPHIVLHNTMQIHSKTQIATKKQTDNAFTNLFTYLHTLQLQDLQDTN